MKKILVALFVITPFLYAQDPVPAEAGQDLIADAFHNAKVIICFDDIDKSFWSGKNVTGSMFFNCFLIDGTNTLTRNIIKEMKVYDAFGSSWIIRPQINRLRIGEWGNFFSGRYSFDGSVLALGEYTIEIETNEGLLYRRCLDLSELSENIDEKDIFMYSSDYTGKIRSGYIQAISRPIITGFDVINETLQIDFKIDDIRVKNAGLTFYDENKKYVGTFEFLYNAYSDETRIEVNNGTNVYNDGTLNRVILKSSSISFGSGKKISDIKKVIVDVYDLEKPEIISVKQDKIRLSAKSGIFSLLNQENPDGRINLIRQLARISIRKM